MRDTTPGTAQKANREQEQRLRELDRKTAAAVNTAAALPLGVVGRNIRTTAPPSTTSTTVAASQPVMTASAPVQAGRLYQVSALHFGLYGVTGTMQANLFYTLDGTVPTTSSTMLDQVNVQTPAGGVPEDAQLSRTFAATADATLTVLLTYFPATAGTGRMNASAGWPIELLITDLGLDPGPAGTTY